MATETSTILDSISDNVPAHIILPPRTLREVIEKVAGYVERSGEKFETRIKEKEAGNPKFDFLQPDDAYRPFYEWRISELKAGRGNALAAGRVGEAGVSTQGREERKGPEAPEEFQFSARLPNISAQDLEVVKLTALFVAKNGRSWMTQLSQRQAGNFQFDFLRPQHSLYQYFSRLIDQYTSLLNADALDGGRPQKKRIVELEDNVSNRFRMLDRARKRAEYTKWQEAQKIAQEEKDQKEKIAYAQIDWHDFSVVETVVFDERDEEIDLPAPTSLNDLQSASLEQKAAMSINPNHRIEEAMPTSNDYDQFYGQQNGPHQPTQNTRLPQTVPHALLQPAVQPSPPAVQAWQRPHEDTSRVATLQAERERARLAQEAAKNAAPAVKIRNDYVPRAQARKQAQNTSICPNCGQAVANDEIQEHMRIEMLDPSWRDQARINQQRSATTNLSTQDVANNLKRLASQRSDVFDPVTGQALSSEEAARRKRIELNSYDGVSTMQPGGTVAGNGAGHDGTEPPDVQEQIRQLHQKFGNKT
nr:pre-mrna-splicing factor [Quercus suber]